MTTTEKKNISPAEMLGVLREEKDRAQQYSKLYAGEPALARDWLHKAAVLEAVEELVVSEVFTA